MHTLSSRVEGTPCQVPRPTVAQTGEFAVAFALKTLLIVQTTIVGGDNILQHPYPGPTKHAQAPPSLNSSQSNPGRTTGNFTHSGFLASASAHAQYPSGRTGPLVVVHLMLQRPPSISRSDPGRLCLLLVQNLIQPVSCPKYSGFPPKNRQFLYTSIREASSLQIARTSLNHGWSRGGLGLPRARNISLPCIVPPS